MRAAVLIFAWITIVAPEATAADLHGAPLPPGARSLDENLFASPKGFRDTVEWYRKQLDKRRLIVEFLPAERVRDVVYLRILSKDPAASWSAIHIVLAEGRTTIYIVPPKNKPLGDRLTAGRRTLTPTI